MDSSLTVSVWPDGQLAGALDSLIGRLTSKVSWQSRHLNSYVGTLGNIVLPRASAEPDQT